jgi:hypothetical protein
MNRGCPATDKITLAVSNFDFSGATVPATLQYRIDNHTSWRQAAPTITLAGEEHQLFFRLSPVQEPVITSGDLNFQGQDGNYYNSATINWTGYQDITIGVAGNKDKLSSMKITSSTIPVPPSVLLLGSGLAGMFFLRRRNNQA